MSISRKKLQSWITEDYSTWDAGKLRYQLDWIMRHYAEQMEQDEQRHNEQMQHLRGHMSASAWLYNELLIAEKAGRKTVRIADVIGASRAHYEAATATPDKDGDE